MHTMSIKKQIKRVACALLAMCALTGVWGAQDAHAEESPIYGAFELKVGTYTPSIDDEFTSPGPYETFFGTDSTLHLEMEWSAYFIQNIGKLGAGLSIGYASDTGDVQVATAGADVSEVPGETVFTTIPLRASLIYRYDYSALHHGIPLVPVVKLGLDYVFWDVEDGDGDTAAFDGTNGEGAKAGWHAALALHLLLDFIDNPASAYMDMTWGVNNSYLFAEYMYTNINDFGGAGFDLSDDIWMFGLAFEF